MQLTLQDKPLEIQRNYRVIKSNQLIQNLRNKTGKLSLPEQKLVLFLISKIKPDATEFPEYEMSCQEFCDICGISRCGANYENIKKTIQKLADRSFWIDRNQSESGKSVEDLVRWISDVSLSGRGRIKLQMHPKLKPFLLQLREFYTAYLLEYILPMKSRYSVALYELLKSYANLKEKTFKVKELKELLEAENYVRWPDFDRKVLSVALREINSLSDLNVHYQIIKKGRAYYAVRFSIEVLDTVQQLERSITREKMLKVDAGPEKYGELLAIGG